MKTTVFIEAPPEFVPLDQRANFIRELLHSEYQPGYRVLDILAGTKMALAIATGVGPLDEDFANVIKLCNSANVPVTIWLTLPDELGYWSNASNTSETFQRVVEIISWSEKYNVKLERVGFDLEWPVQLAQAQQSGKWIKFFKLFKSYKKKFDPHAQANFEKTLGTLEAFGIGYEFYVFPPILHKLSATGLEIPEGARVIEMDYSSFSPRFIAQWIIRKTRDWKTIPAIGIVNGIEKETPGRMLSPKLPRNLTSEDIGKDLSTIGRTNELYVFAMNSAEALKTILKGMV